MSLPLMFSLLVQSLYNIVDSIVVARLSENALTATLLAYPVQILMVAVAVGSGVGVNLLLSRTFGAKKYEEAGKIATTGLILAAASSVVFLLLGIFCAKTFVSLFTSDPEISVYCEQYLSICMIFCTGTFIETMCQRFLQAVGSTVLSMVSLVAGAVTAFLIHMKKIRRLRSLQGRIAGEIYKVGLPTALTQALGSIMVSAFNGILMPFSSTAVAFFGVYYKLQNFLFMPMNGLGQAAIPIVGYNYGNGNGKRVKEIMRTILPIGGGIAILGTAIFMIFPRQLLQLFSASEEMLALGVPALRIISVTFLFATMTIVLGYAASGLGNGLINMIGTALRQFIIFVPLAHFLAKYQGITRVWYSVWISETVAVCYSILSSWHEFRKKLKTIT